MKGPLSNYVMERESGEDEVLLSDCLKEECAWWEPKIGKCSILRMWIALQDIHEVLHDIATQLSVRR